MKIVVIIIGLIIFLTYATTGTALEIVLGCIVPMGLMVYTALFSITEKMKREERQEFAKRRRMERERELAKAQAQAQEHERTRLNRV